MNATVDYSAKPGTYFSADRPEMLRFVPLQAIRVLEVGCGRGNFAAALKKGRRIHVTAIEPFAEAAREASDRVDRLIESDVESGLQQLAAETFDCVVFNDVLEHLVDPWRVLSTVGRLLTPSGVVVASIPNMRHLPVLKDLLLRGQWRYADDGVMDRTHLRFFTTKSIRDMFTSSGYELQHIEGINGGNFSWKFTLLNRLVFNALADARYLQIAVVAGAWTPKAAQEPVAVTVAPGSQ